MATINMAALGNRPVAKTVYKFGLNPDIAGAAETVDYAGGTYAGWITAASAVRVKAGGNAADTAAGAGARKIIVSGLDQNWAEAQEEITLAGASASAATTTTFIRVYRAYITDVGAYGGLNTGAITVETTGGTVVAYIQAGAGQTQFSGYTIPAGYTGWLGAAVINVDPANTARVSMWQRRNADTVAAPYTGARLVYRLENVSGYISDSLIAHIPFPAKTDVWWTAAKQTGGGNTSVSINFDIILTDDDN